MNFLKTFTFSLLMIAPISLPSGCSSPPPASNPNGLQVGDRAYDCSLMDETGHWVRLFDTKPGWYLVVVLYRGAYCSSCRTMLFDLKDDYPKFVALHASIVAVSSDTLEDSADFNRQWQFPFPLLSDPQFHLIDAYGARHPNGHGIHDVARPSIIIIDPQKIIRYKKMEFKPYDLPTDDEMLFFIRRLEKSKRIQSRETTPSNIRPNGPPSPKRG